MKDSKKREEWAADDLISRDSTRSKTQCVRMPKSNAIKEKIKSQKTEFTLIEMLVVCILLFFLMALSMSGLKIAMTKSAENATISMIKQITIAMEAYKAKYGFYIPSLDGRGGDLKIRSDEENLKQFLPKYTQWTKDNTIDSSGVVFDAFMGKLWFRSPGFHNRGGFDLESAGADGKFGYDSDINKHSNPSSKDEAADNINNWSN